MDSTQKPPRPQRHPVLILSHADGTIEIFAERHIDVHFARVPVAHSREAEQTAEAVTELLLPRRYRDIFWPNKRRAVGTTRPLLPSKIHESNYVRDLIHGLNNLTTAELPTLESEVTVWT